MERAEMENRVYQAAFEGDVPTLNQLLERDPFVLLRVSLNCSSYNPLHIAVLKGHEQFVRAILDRNSELFAELEPGKKSSPLHLAAANGHLGIAEALLNTYPDMCFVLNPDGRNPVHVAAIKGQLQVLRRLVQARPFAAREKTKRGEPILHLCVKYGQVKALRQLVGAGFDDYEFLNQRDADGLTALHLAVLENQDEIVHYLLKNTRIDINAKNADGRTARDIASEKPTLQGTARDIVNSLIQAKALKAEQIPPLSKLKRFEKKSKDLMVVASLIAAMAFQAGVSPPGGTWQDDLTTDSNGYPVPHPHRAGESIMAYHRLDYYKYFLRFNTTAFVSSLGTILLIITGLPFKNSIFTWVLRIVMWLTATSIALTYGFSIAFVTPAIDREQLGHLIQVAIGAWSVLITVILMGRLGYSMKNWIWWQSGRTMPGSKIRGNHQDLENQANGHHNQVQV